MDLTTTARPFSTSADLSLSPQGTWKDRSRSATATSILEQAIWTPGVIMYTNSQVQVIKLDLPGVNMQDVRIDVEPGMLTVSGNSKCGTFYRRISLRYNAPLGQLRSNMSQGVLEIDVPNPAM